jgi:hypothetical protein
MATYRHLEVPDSPSGPWFSQRVTGWDTEIAGQIILTNEDGSITRLHGNFVTQGWPRTAGTVESLSRTDADGSIIYETISGLARHSTRS